MSAPDSTAIATQGNSSETPPAPFTPRPPESFLEIQIALASRGFSCGALDGKPGEQTSAALRAFQKSRHLPGDGEINQETSGSLLFEAEPFTELVLTATDAAQFQPLSTTWLGKSQQSSLAFESALEWAAEFSHAHPALLRRLNPDIVWENILPGARIRVPAVSKVDLGTKAARLQIRLAEHVLEAFDEGGELIAHFPVSIALKAEKRPAGLLKVTVVIPNPDYTFDPALFPESAEAKSLDTKLIIPPGPNNPVGVAWIGLDRPGYGIHGTPSPEKIGRTESHGCFRLANWDARTLLRLAWSGMPVEVLP